LLKQIAPNVTRVGVLRNPDNPTGPANFGVIQAMAPSLNVEVNSVNIRDTGEIERGIASFARSTNSGLIVIGSALVLFNRDLIVTLAARHKLPAVYYRRNFVTAGGLISYGSNIIDHSRRAAGYVDRILKGEKPAELPVQAPTNYEMVLNLKTAKALGSPSRKRCWPPPTRSFNETAGVHCGARERGGMTACGVGPAGRTDATDRRADAGH